MIGGYNIGCIQTAGTCTEYSRLYRGNEETLTAAIQCNRHSCLSSVLPPTLFASRRSATFPGLSSKVHGSKEHEKKKESFNPRHLALSRHVGSVKFEMTNDPLTLSCSLKSLYEYWPSSAPFIATAWSHCVSTEGQSALLHVSGKEEGK